MSLPEEWIITPVDQLKCLIWSVRIPVVFSSHVHSSYVDVVEQTPVVVHLDLFGAVGWWEVVAALHIHSE